MSYMFESVDAAIEFAEDRDAAIMQEALIRMQKSNTGMRSRVTDARGGIMALTCSPRP